MEIPRIEGLELNEGQAITRFTAEDLTTSDSVPHRVLAGENIGTAGRNSGGGCVHILRRKWPAAIIGM